MYSPTPLRAVLTAPFIPNEGSRTSTAEELRARLSVMRREESLPTSSSVTRRTGTGQRIAMPVAQRANRVQHHRDAGLHVESTGAGKPAVGSSARHLGQGSEGIDGVEMAEQQHGLASATSWKVNLEMVAEILRLMKFGVAAEFLEATGKQRAQAVHGALVVAGRLDLDELARGFKNGFAALFEVAQAVQELGFHGRG